MILASDISIFDFQTCVFSRKLTLLLRAASADQQMTCYVGFCGRQCLTAHSQSRSQTMWRIQPCQTLWHACATAVSAVESAFSGLVANCRPRRALGLPGQRAPERACGCQQSQSAAVASDIRAALLRAIKDTCSTSGRLPAST